MLIDCGVIEERLNQPPFRNQFSSRRLMLLVPDDEFVELIRIIRGKK